MPQSPRFLLASVVSLFLLMAGCDSGGPSIEPVSCEASTIPAEPTQVDPQNYITTASGLSYVEFSPGTGETAEAGDLVDVHYTGWLTSGFKFDSSVDRGCSFRFDLGRGQVIQGWDEGVQGLKVGGRRQLVIPPALGYGSRALQGIPANSTLVFEIELMQVQ